MDVETLKAELRDVDGQINDLSRRKLNLKQQIADALAVFKVGDIVTYDGAGKVWSVTSIHYGSSVSPNYYGAKLKKDGKPGVIASRLHYRYNAPLRLATPEERA